MRVDLYAETNTKGTRAMKRWCMYLVACETPKGLATAGDFVRSEGTYNRAILETVCKALRRIKQGSEVHLHTSNNVITDMIEYNIEDMAERGFIKKDGNPVANRAEWQEYWYLTRQMLIIPEPGNHSFSSWMASELYKHEKEQETEQE